ncbi:Tetratricopeptide-like helical [Cordyceps militaris]|uniref:Tetratricopeptide-like helical n=1 Tax=Cordyceps militaris TaxID=73501 RepID=A0A2H4SNQ7_CORMI|nr:Tetratricopeptide-like helical [Cordyceps militaris]
MCDAIDEVRLAWTCWWLVTSMHLIRGTRRWTIHLRRLYFMTTHAGSSVRRNHAPWAFNDTVYMTSPACGIGLNKAASGKQVTGSPENSAWLADLVKSGWRMGNWCTFSRTAAELVGGDKYWHRCLTYKGRRGVAPNMKMAETVQNAAGSIYQPNRLRSEYMSFFFHLLLRVCTGLIPNPSIGMSPRHLSAWLPTFWLHCGAIFNNLLPIYSRFSYKLAKRAASRSSLPARGCSSCVLRLLKADPDANTAAADPLTPARPSLEKATETTYLHRFLSRRFLTTLLACPLAYSLAHPCQRIVDTNPSKAQMPPKLGATFVPGGFDDYYMPEVVAPSPQRVTPQVPQAMQDDIQRMELEAVEIPSRRESDDTLHQTGEPSTSSQTAHATPAIVQDQSKRASVSAQQYASAYHKDDSISDRLDSISLDGAPSFSPFPKVVGDNIPPGDDTKEEILWNSRKHVLHSQNVAMQISWARDVLNWVEISVDAAVRENAGVPRPSTPRTEHELRVDAINVVTYLAEQEHPDALYMRSKWLEFGKFGNRTDKREAYNGYTRASGLGHARSDYRIGMLYEQSNDISKAKEHYYKGMSLKDSAALYRMGMMSLLGQHGESKDYAGGLERIRLAAESSDEDAPQGAYVYGMITGRDLPDIALPEGLLPSNLETARMYIEKAAYQGFAKAQLKMGQAFELCQLGCEFKPAYSLHYYGLAAKQGIPEAALGVSRWFLFGYEGVFKKNEELAYKYAREAAAAKLPTGEFAMGYYYEIGIHVNKSLSEAKKWYELAAEHGNTDALGRLESLDQDITLSKKDHETTTLTRIKSQHGSMRGKRPERFAQAQKQHLPTLNESEGSGKPSNGVSPMPSPGVKPTIVSEHADLPDASRASVVGGLNTIPAFNIRLDSQPDRPQSAAPYPVDDHPAPLNLNRPKSTAPYPDDEPTGKYIQHSQGLGPQADRPMSAFGIRTSSGGAAPIHQQASNLHPSGPANAGRGQPALGPGGYRPSPAGTHPGEMNYQRPSTTQPYPSDTSPPNKPQQRPPRQSYGGIPPAGSQHGYDYSPRVSSRPQHDAPPPPPQHMSQQTYPPRVPLAAVGSTGRPDRYGSLPPQDPRQSRTPTGMGTPDPSRHGLPPSPAPGVSLHGRVATAPPGGSRPPPPKVETPASGTPKPNKGPATFEDMGIPQGKNDGDCVR